MTEVFEGLWAVVRNSVTQFTIRDAVDIALVTVFIYYILKLARQTRAIQVLKGLGIMLAAAVASQWLNLSAFAAVLNYIIASGPILLVIIFLPEIRRAFEQLGRSRLFDKPGEQKDGTVDLSESAREMFRVIMLFAKRRIGALIVVEQQTALGDIIDTGTRLNAEISAYLLENIFTPNTPLHDGAAVIRGERITAAGCFLPLSENKEISRMLGTRHRAALGMSEVSDAVVLVVSEETGIISVASAGKLTRYLDTKALQEVLDQLFSKEPRRRSLFKTSRKKA